MPLEFNHIVFYYIEHYLNTKQEIIFPLIATCRLIIRHTELWTK